jgi:hypothetical protein
MFVKIIIIIIIIIFPEARGFRIEKRLCMAGGGARNIKKPEKKKIGERFV